MIINIDTAGQIQMIHSDDMVELLREGKATIARASHVEPNADGTWSADLAPVNGPVLGPFQLRGEALAAEVTWLERNLLGGAA